MAEKYKAPDFTRAQLASQERDKEARNRRPAANYVITGQSRPSRKEVHFYIHNPEVLEAELGCLGLAAFDLGVQWPPESETELKQVNRRKAAMQVVRDYGISKGYGDANVALSPGGLSDWDRNLDLGLRTGPNRLSPTY